VKRIVIIISVLIISIIVGLFITKETKIKVELDKCVDGDTAWFIINNNRKKYRFLSIDTMESDTEFGLITSEYVCDLLNDANNIEIEYSKFGKTKDKYNRELVFVFLDDELLQEKLISEGYARLKYVYAKYEYLDDLIESEKDAINKKNGLWNEQFNNNYSEHNVIENPKKLGCRFIGWEYNNKLYDMTIKINDEKKLKSKFDC